MNSIEEPNVILAQYKELKVYESDIQILEEQYINSLPDKDDIYNVSCFRGLLTYINRRLIKNIVTYDIDNYNILDFSVIESVFYNIYIPLCSKYHKTPTLQTFFTTIVNIGYRYILHVLEQREYTKLKDYESNNNRYTALTKMQDICISGTLDKVQEQNSIGGIFIAKSVYGINDNAPQVIQLQQLPGAEATPEQIAAKYKDIKLPPAPDFNA